MYIHIFSIYSTMHLLQSVLHTCVIFEQQLKQTPCSSSDRPGGYARLPCGLAKAG